MIQIIIYLLNYQDMQFLYNFLNDSLQDSHQESLQNILHYIHIIFWWKILLIVILKLPNFFSVEILITWDTTKKR